MLSESDRKDLAIQALARSTTISDLSVRHSVSRKFVYQQAHKAGAALDEVSYLGRQKTTCCSTCPSARLGCAR